MFKSIYLKTELKKIFREPIMAMLFLVPLIIPAIFRLLLEYLIPYIQTFVEFDISPYNIYILTFVMLLSSMLLSIIIGFSMIDDRDNKISELMHVTPMGKAGYVAMRLSLVFVFVILYSLYSYLVMGMYVIPLWSVFIICLILSFFSGVMGLLLFSVATDKVNGLTYAKGLNVISFFAFVDLLGLKWLNILGGFFPPYWIKQIIANPYSVLNYILGILVTAAWFAVFIRAYNKMDFRN